MTCSVELMHRYPIPHLFHVCTSAHIGRQLFTLGICLSFGDPHLASPKERQIHLEGHLPGNRVESRGNILLWNMGLDSCSRASAKQVVCRQPVGLGTPLVESLASYILRLAEAHCVFPDVLVSKMVAPLQSDIEDIELLRSEVSKDAPIFASLQSEAFSNSAKNTNDRTT